MPKREDYVRISLLLREMGARIIATDYHLPEKIYSNHDFFAEFPEMAGSGILKTGVVKRHIAQKHEISSDLGIMAANKLMNTHPGMREKIDFILYNSADLDYYTPATSCVLQHKLELSSRCGTMDIVNGCSSYPYSLGIAKGVIEAMGAKNVLLINSSTLTRFIHKGDKANRFLFGDGAAATVITSSEDDGIGPFVYGTRGEDFEKIIIRDGFARNPVTEDSLVDTTDQYGNVTNGASFRMDGIGIFLFSARTVPPMIEELMGKAQLTASDIDLYIFHQPNVYLNEHLRKKMDIPEDKFVHCMADTGNTVQSTIPIAITDARRSGRLKAGMRVLVAGFGTGLSWSATIVRF